MKKKLTLLIEDEVLERAKRYARSQGSSLSELVETYLTEQTSGGSWSPPAGSVLARLTGAITPDSLGQSDDERRQQVLREKYV